jgi:two-component system chemotaxis response regulator CheB
MHAIHQVGGINLTEHEDSCVVYGMPRAAVNLGVVDKLVMLEQMPKALLEALAELPT